MSRRLFDFKCDTCDRVTERLIDGDEHELPCDRSACGGTARRLIGGGPVPRGAAAPRFPRELPDRFPSHLRANYMEIAEAVVPVAPDATLHLHAVAPKPKGRA